MCSKVQGFYGDTWDGYEYPLPEWATDRNDGGLVIGATLPTKDGRKCGNSVVTHIYTMTTYAGGEDVKEVYCLLTDIGTVLEFTALEIEQFFHPSEYICDLTEAIEKRC